MLRALQLRKREADGLAVCLGEQRHVLLHVRRQLRQFVLETLVGIVGRGNLGVELRVQLAQNREVVVSRLADGDGSR